MLSNISLKPGTTISGNLSSYKIKELKGQGVYGTVVRCIDRASNQDVAVKLSREKKLFATKHEANILQELITLSHSQNVVRYIDSFHFQNHYCLVLEHLDMDLLKYMKTFKKLIPIADIRYITSQLLVTFNELAKYKLVHGDLKPSHVMLVDHKHEPFRVKLIDFGMSRRLCSLKLGEIFQPLGLRAPEMSLGAKLTCAIDIWGLGCILAHMYLGRNLFPHSNEYQSFQEITRLCGMPEQQMLRQSLFTEIFFIEEGRQYRLKKASEYYLKGSSLIRSCTTASKYYNCLDDMITLRVTENFKEKMDTELFFDLLNLMLEVNPAKRISAAQALQHPFIMQRSKNKSPTMDDPIICHTRLKAQGKRFEEYIHNSSSDHDSSNSTEKREASHSINKTTKGTSLATKTRVMFSEDTLSSYSLSSDSMGQSIKTLNNDRKNMFKIMMSDQKMKLHCRTSESHVPTLPKTQVTTHEPQETTMKSQETIQKPHEDIHNSSSDYDSSNSTEKSVTKKRQFKQRFKKKVHPLIGFKDKNVQMTPMYLETSIDQKVSKTYIVKQVENKVGTDSEDKYVRQENVKSRGSVLLLKPFKEASHSINKTTKGTSLATKIRVMLSENTLSSYSLSSDSMGQSIKTLNNERKNMFKTTSYQKKKLHWTSENHTPTLQQTQGEIQKLLETTTKQQEVIQKLQETTTKQQEAIQKLQETMTKYHKTLMKPQETSVKGKIGNVFRQMFTGYTTVSVKD